MAAIPRQERFELTSAGDAPRDRVRAVRLLFLIILLVLVMPSRLMALSHGAPVAVLAGATVSTLLVCWLLYRLCLRAAHQAWFIAASIPALYLSAFGAPLYAWASLLVLLVVHRFVVGTFRRPADARTRADGALPASDARPVGPQVPPGAIPPWVHAIDLDGVCGPYRRFLFSQRVIRAATAAAASTVLVIPAALVDDGTPALDVAIAALLTVSVALIAWMSFSWLRALWEGSAMAARKGLLVCAAAAVVWVVVGITRLDGDEIASGEIWFHVTGHALQLSILAAMALGSAIVVTRRHDAMFMGLLHQNAGRDRRTTLLQLCGVMLPAGPWFKALVHRSLVLSVLAFCLEGLAFYVYFRASSRVLALPEILVFPFPGSSTVLERHYFSAVTIAAFVLPVAYVSTQVTLAAAERLRRAANRASLRKAEDVLRDDPRPPVLFLRDFKDDQVSLDRAAMPGWARTLDPSLEQANLEDVLAACLNIGPVVAIGRPGDVTPPVGAARRYVSDDEWQSVVLSMMEASAVVVAGVSDSPGLGWEIDRLRDRQHLGKAVFVIPPTDRRNHRLTHLLVSRLQPRLDPGGRDAVIAGLEPAIGARHVVGVTLRQGVVTVFVTERQPSQVELDAMLRLTLPAPQAAPREDTSR